jgi:hypothetical protein
MATLLNFCASSNTFVVFQTRVAIIEVDLRIPEKQWGRDRCLRSHAVEEH